NQASVSAWLAALVDLHEALDSLLDSLAQGGGEPPSSAVPVLPATVTPGTAAEVPVPSHTTAIIISRTSRAIAVELTRMLACGPPSENVGVGRRPPSPIVEAITPISSGLASTAP